MQNLRIDHLTASQQEWVASVIEQFRLPHHYQRDSGSDWITDEVLNRLGDAMRIHHAFSRQPLTKDRFEYAFERALNLADIPAQLEYSRTNRGHDLTIQCVPVSLKTEAAANIKTDSIHVSKWMELGRGNWDLATLRDMFLEHLRNYERIFTLRCITRRPQTAPIFYIYELVEIPKALMLEAEDCELVVREQSTQNPKPGYGYVRTPGGTAKYSLYFDAGSERKLQIKHLKKELCRVHATWEFESTAL